MTTEGTVSTTGVSSICTGSSWTVDCCGCSSLWSVSEAVVSDTGVEEVLVLVLSVVSGDSSVIVVLAAEGIGLGSLELDVPILRFVSGTLIEAFCWPTKFGIMDGGGCW